MSIKYDHYVLVNFLNSNKLYSFTEEFNFYFANSRVVLGAKSLRVKEQSDCAYLGSSFLGNKTV